MREYTGNKEAYPFRKPQGFRTIRFHLAAEAVEWLNGTTRDNAGNTVGNHALFYDLLSRMRSAPGRDGSFRRPQELQAGQFQFSETGLAEEWKTGRKKVRNLLATMGEAGLDSGNRFQNRFRSFRDLHRGLDGHAGQLCQ